jgi:hypothetical protein
MVVALSICQSWASLFQNHWHNTVEFYLSNDIFYSYILYLFFAFVRGRCRLVMPQRRWRRASGRTGSPLAARQWRARSLWSPARASPSQISSPQARCSLPASDYYLNDGTNVAHLHSHPGLMHIAPFNGNRHFNSEASLINMPQYVTAHSGGIMGEVWGFTIFSCQDPTAIMQGRRAARGS